MRVGHLAAPNLGSYGSTSTPGTSSYVQDSIGPHGITQRYSYTVPSNRRAIVQAGTVELCVRTAGAGGNSERWARWQVSGITQMIARVYVDAVGQQNAEVLGAEILLLTADTLTSLTYDGTVGGNVDYCITARRIEYS